MPELHDSLIARLAALLAGLPPRRRLVIGVSGGVDSMLLLELARSHAAAAGMSVLAVHVHHGLSPRADAWAAHVGTHCAATGVPCTVLRVAVDRARPSREAAARDARHAAFASLLQPGDALLLAHHADDQAETVLLRLLRGSGLTGLGAMRPVRPVHGAARDDDVDGNAFLLRPLLDVPRATILQAATEAGLAWIEDESNTDTSFDRNFLRHEVLPRLRARWPAVTGTLADTARRLAGADALLNDYLDADLAPLLADDGAAVPDAATLDAATLDAAGLLAQAPAKRTALLRRWLARRGAPVFGEAWLQQLLALAASRVDGEGELCVAGWEMHRFRGRLHAFPQLAPVDAERTIAWLPDRDPALDLGPGHGILVAQAPAGPAAGGTGLAHVAISPGQALAVRFRAGGERLAPAGGIGSRPLKKVLQELDLPPWLRARVPLLYLDDRLVAVGDLAVDAAFAPGPGRPATVRLQWTRPASSQ